MNHDFHYTRADGSCTINRFSARDQGNDVSWSLGSALDSYDYSKASTSSYRDLVVERLKDLRQRYDYIRLWFTGGRDSRMVLDTAIQHGIHIDETVSVSQEVFDGKIRTLQSMETDQEVLPYLRSHAAELAKTRQTIVHFQDRHFARVFADPAWHLKNYSNSWNYCSAYYSHNMYQHNAEEFGLEPVHNRVDLMGCLHPHIWWEDGWRFQYVDMQFQDLGPTVEWFTLADNMPELLHAYVKEVTGILEKSDTRPGRFQMSINNIRNLHPDYASIELNNSEVIPPKNWSYWVPSDHPCFKISNSFRNMFNLIICSMQDPLPQGYKNYIENTDWDMLKKEFDHGGITTKMFSI